MDDYEAHGMSRDYRNMDIRKYLRFLDDEGWSEREDERCTDEVKQLLTS